MSDKLYVEFKKVLEMEDLLVSRGRYDESSPFYSSLSNRINEMRQERNKRKGTLDELKRQEELDNRVFVPLEEAIKAFKEGKEIICWDDIDVDHWYSRHQYDDNAPNNQLTLDSYEVMSTLWTIND